METQLLSFLLITFSYAGSSPVPGHLNALAKDFGASMVDVGKDVILTPGKDGNNFNAKSESSGQALVSVTGGVFGSALNRNGQEFNAVAKGNSSSSQVRVLGDVSLEHLNTDAKKFDAVSESGGQSIVQVGNVQIISVSSRKGKEYDAVQVSGPVRKLSVDKDHHVVTKNGREEPLGPSWGAAAVADHNTRPWEDLENDLSGGLNVNTNESDLFAPPPTNNKPSDVGLEIHEYPHDNSFINGTDSSGTLKPHELNSGSLNADSKGVNSNSIVQVKGSVLV